MGSHNKSTEKKPENEQKKGSGFKKKLIRQAIREGFDGARIVAPDAILKTSSFLYDYLKRGYHGDMEWMENRADQRANPRNLWPDVKSILVLAQNYGPEHNPLDLLQHKDKGIIASYAHGVDYHDVVKKRLKSLARWIVKHQPCELKVFVDTAPVMEKLLGAASGLGWQGKHTNLVSKEFGSWVLLGAIYLDFELVPDLPEPDHCGTCTRCLDICPTNAFPKPYQLDARKCISYLTIEHKGPIDSKYYAAIGNRIFGCDDCLAICPWNKFAKSACDIKLKARTELSAQSLEMYVQMDEEAFRAFFSKTPVKRIGWSRFMRNVLIAISNSNNVKLLALARAHMGSEDPLIKQTVHEILK